ncbi:PadR family transcriptional regulator [Pseudobacteroides cellulosolvens]|uniref:Transcriptional regulator, PadR-like family n=1 Tax=Pseudobacteroides cellulosolvens ATCC 35603 = DSM 2933 TaxID=398512 RepID=A0A0L6JSP8_9FIRM|nr:PadR family transcriptional regulator [Pseudobacteroides cellulosolvens]KNY28871.1 transcriptional regulator, PadR-like family [Pseudobacteroides cellulosolvens ATCC 35603 = DSM 2933]
MPKINKTRYAILGVLNIAPGSGYDIKKNCDRGISYFWNENFGHIYPVLKQMEKDGVIQKSVEQNEGRPPRNVYSITQKGKDELVDWLMRPIEPTPQRLELMLKLTFAKMVPVEYTLQELERVRERHSKSLECFRKVEEEYSNNKKAREDKGYPYWLSTIRYGIYDAEFRVRWCEETIERIRAYNAGSEDV